jgi:hypothetical protein
VPQIELAMEANALVREHIEASSESPMGAAVAEPRAGLWSRRGLRLARSA